MLDYGGQYSQLIARRVRDCGVFSELLPAPRRRSRRSRARKPRGIILSGGPASVYARRARRALERGLLELGRAGDGHLLRHAAARARRSAAASSRPRWASSAARSCTCREPGVLLRGTAARADLLDVPPRHRVRAAARASPRSPPRARSPVAAVEDTERGHLRDPVPPRGRAHALRPGDPDALPDRGLRLRARPGRRRRSSRNRSRRIREQVGDGKRDLRALRRRRLLGRGAARAPRGRRPADVRVRRPRPDAQGRGRAGRQHLPRHLQGAARGRRRRDALPREAAAA